MGGNDLLRGDGKLLEVGNRVECEGHNGTVKFIGDILSTTGVWLGIEWDDPSRGKHDGSHNGKRYFKTSHSTSGSFIRPKKANLGKTCLSAIKDRYGKIDDDMAGVDTEELFVLDSRQNVTVVEMVGAKSVNEKQSELENLQEVVLREMAVCSAGLENELHKNCFRIAELDLSKNLFTLWEEVSKIAHQLPHLTSLNVSENVLRMPKMPNTLASSFSKVKRLFLNRMDLCWEKILECSVMFPILEELHVCFNCLQTICGPNVLLNNLTLLNLESNSISEWKEILKLGKSTRLKTLILNDNGITNIEFPDSTPTEKTAYFKNLTSLSLNHNKVSQWTDINELNKLESLEELRLKHNPLLETANPQTIQQIIVAKVANLKMYNRTEISDDERKGAEIDYLKRFGPEWMKAGGCQEEDKNNPSAEFTSSHPRFQKLVDKWEAPEDSEMVQKTATLKDNLITVQIFSPLTPDKKAFQKKLPITMSILKLKALIQRLYKVDSGDLILTYISQKMEGPEIEFDNDLRQISFYSVESGDTINVKW